MSDTALRSGLIRLAHAKPELRGELLPLLTKRAEYGVKPTESELQSMQEIIRVWGKALAAALGGQASVVEQSSASQIIVAVTLPDLAPNATIRAHVGMLKGEFVVGMHQWGLPSWATDALEKSAGKGWLDAYRYYGTPEEVMRDAARATKDVAQKLKPIREQADLRRDTDAVFGQVVPKLHAWVQKALSSLAVAGPLRVSGGSNAAITGQGIPYAEATVYVSGLISRADKKDKMQAERVLDKATEVLAQALSHFTHDGIVATLAPERPQWTGELYQVRVVLYSKKAPVRLAAAGIPVTLKKKLSLKDGTVIEAGEKGTLRFNEQTPRQAVVDFDVRPNTKLGCRLLGDYFGRPFMKEPSMSALENMGDGIAKSVTGKKVEPDGYGPDGSPSWLLALGMI